MAEINKNSGFNSMIAYTGHGMIEHHPANMTVAGVFGHESGHLNEARSMALMTGDTIVSEKIEMDYVFENGKLIARGGKATTVTAREKQVAGYRNIKDFGAKRSAAANVKSETPAAGKTQNKISEINNEDKKLDSKADQLNQQLQQQKAKLDGELRKVEQQVKNGLNSIETPADPAQAEQTAKAPVTVENARNGELKDPGSDVRKRQAQARVSMLKEQISRVENMITSLEIAKSLNMLSKLMDSVVAASTSFGMNMAQASLGNIAAASNNSIPSAGSEGQPASNNNSAPKLFENSPSRSGGGSLANVINMIEANLRGALVNIRI